MACDHQFIKISRFESLKSFLTERLSAAAKEIFVVMEQTITKCEGDISSANQENARLRSLVLDVAVNPEMLVSDSRMLTLSGSMKGPPEWQEWSPCLRQEDPEPTLIKEDQEGRTSHWKEQSPYMKDSPQSSHAYQTVDSSALADTETGRRMGKLQPCRDSQPPSEGNTDSPSARSESPSESESKESDAEYQQLQLKNPPMRGSGKGQRVRGQSLKVSGRKGAETSFQEFPSFSIQIQQPSFTCKVCGKSFKHMGNINVHVRVHTQEEPYRCGVCGKQCRSSEELTGHYEIHIGEKAYRCHSCGKGFKQVGELTVHMRVHTGEKPFKCSECGKTFISATTLRVHQKIHTGEYPYCCEVCGKCFTQKVHLNMHMKVHIKGK